MRPLAVESAGREHSLAVAEAARVAPSQRATTSSRHPGSVFAGTVWKTAIPLVRCELCGALRYLFTTNWAHTVTRTADCGPGESIDCQGQKVSHR